MVKKYILEIIFFIFLFATCFIYSFAFFLLLFFPLYIFYQKREIKKSSQDFLGLCSHELKSYLQIISGYTEMIIEDEISPEQKIHCLKKINATSKRLHAFMEALLDLEKNNCSKKSFLLLPFLEKIEEGFKAKHPSKILQINNHTSMEKIKGHPDLLFLALINLIDNAVKHGSCPILKINSSDNNITFCVQDAGKGVPLGDLSKVFTRNFTLDPSKGSGLGLYLVKKIVDYHQAKISVSSSETKGALFTIDLPL